MEGSEGVVNNANIIVRKGVTSLSVEILSNLNTVTTSSFLSSINVGLEQNTFSSSARNSVSRIFTYCVFSPVVRPERAA